MIAFKSSGQPVEYFVASWGSSVGAGDCRYTKQVITWLPASRLSEEPWTLGRMAEVLLECLRVLESGRFPSVDLSGSPEKHALVGEEYGQGWSCRWAGFKHDWKARVQVHRHFRSYLCDDICDLDLATVEDDVYSFTNVSETAPWYATILSLEDYLQQCRDIGVNPSPYSGLVGFRLERSLWDGLHTFWHQGVCSDFSGSVCWQLAHDPQSGWAGTDVEEKLKSGFREYCLWEMTQAYYQSLSSHTNKCRVWCKRALMVTKEKSQPSFTDQYKAAHVRLFAIFLSEKYLSIYESLPSPTRRESVLASACKSLIVYLVILKKGGPVLSASEAAKAQTNLREFLVSYVYLAADALSRDVALYRVRPKLHSADHICHNLKVSRENPRYHEVWLEEDFLGKVSKLIKATHGSKNALRAMQRWSINCWNLWYNNRK